MRIWIENKTNEQKQTTEGDLINDGFKYSKVCQKLERVQARFGNRYVDEHKQIRYLLLPVAMFNPKPKK